MNPPWMEDVRASLRAPPPEWLERMRSFVVSDSEKHDASERLLMDALPASLESPRHDMAEEPE